MNGLYLTVMAYIVISAIRGYHKGFLRVIYSIVSLAATIVFMAAAIPVVSGLLQEHTTIQAQLEVLCRDYIQEKAGAEAAGRILSGSFGLKSDAVSQLLEGLPKELQEQFLQGTEETLDEVMGLQELYDKAAETAAVFFVHAAAGIISFIAIQIVLHIIKRKLNLFTRKPEIRILDRILGFIIGIVKSFLVIWAVFLFIRVTAFLPSSMNLIQLIEEDQVLKVIYENNLLFNLLQNFPAIWGMKMDA